MRRTRVVWAGLNLVPLVVEWMEFSKRVRLISRALLIASCIFALEHSFPAETVLQQNDRTPPTIQQRIPNLFRLDSLATAHSAYVFSMLRNQ